MRHGTLWPAAALSAALMLGCGGREFSEVEGTVTLDGQPLAFVEVVFLPESTKGNEANNASAFTDADGRYQLFAARDNRAGTVLGPHRVIITDLTMVADSTGAGNPAQPGAAAMPGTKPRRFPKAYGDAAETPFRDIEVGRGKQTLNFQLNSTKRPEKSS